MPIPLGLVGLDYQSAPLSVREAIAKGFHEAAQAKQAEHPFFPQGAVLLSTCHRIEVYFDRSHRSASSELVLQGLARAAGMTAGQLAPYVSIKEGRDVVRHLIEVAAGLRSMTLGEGQILGQVREAFESAGDALSPIMQRLYQCAVRAGKRVRTKTRIGQARASLADMAIHQLTSMGVNIRGKPVLLVGSGRMARLVLHRVVLLGAAPIKVVCRRPEAFRLSEIAGIPPKEVASRIEVLPMTRLEEACLGSDLIFSATASPSPVISAAVLERAIRWRNESLCVVDLAVPRDVEPFATLPDLLTLLTVDDLASDERQASQADLELAHAIVRDAESEFCEWVTSLPNIPTIVSMRQQANRIRNEELERLLTQLGPLTEQQRERLVAFSHRLINKVLHFPTVVMKQGNLR